MVKLTIFVKPRKILLLRLTVHLMNSRMNMNHSKRNIMPSDKSMRSSEASISQCMTAYLKLPKILKASMLLMTNNKDRLMFCFIVCQSSATAPGIITSFGSTILNGAIKRQMAPLVIARTIQRRHLNGLKNR